MTVEALRQYIDGIVDRYFQAFSRLYSQAGITGVFSGSVTVGSHLVGGGVSPTVSGGATLDSRATDISGTVTGGANSTGWTLTFSNPYTNIPHVNISSPNGSFYTGYTVTQNGITLTNLSATGAVFTYIVVG